jgi:hypothetical protein
METVVVSLTVSNVRIELYCQGLLPQIVITLGEGIPTAAATEEKVLPSSLAFNSKRQDEVIPLFPFFVLSPALPLSTESAAAAAGELPQRLEEEASVREPTTSPTSQVGVTPVEISTDPAFTSLVSRVNNGLHLHPPELIEEGVGGAYFMRDEKGDICAVFKPCDEEPNARNNPKGNTGDIPSGIKEGTVAGEGARNEYIAYLLDKDNFSGVPCTGLVYCSHSAFHDPEKERDAIKTKMGSLQEYIPHESSCEDRGSSLFPKNQVHKIGILDVRLCNTDRHLGNILVKKESGSSTLVPIDHGLCLPSKLSDALFEWCYWPQAKMPFDPATLQYIESLDPEADAILLRSKFPAMREESIDTMRICTMLLKKGARAGLTLYNIACLVGRMANLDEPSQLEQLCDVARDHQTTGGDFWVSLANQLDNLLSSLASAPN